ncbi:MAG: hypothetical protein FOGNACKC_00754 [Anaerolineae bacterium]|nr:hypothetical protein [Anaerolineae bacterium]
MKLDEIVQQIKNATENIILIYAFNSMGKTRLSVAYKNGTKKEDGQHSGVYYNAFSEDIFVWDNNGENNEGNICLTVNSSSLNRFHSVLTEDAIREKLQAFNHKFDFKFNPYKDPEKGIKSISFFLPDNDQGTIKISRGEERIFVWCFFLALFEVEDWTGQQPSHYFIDDPVSSLDDHNIFVTASTLRNLVEKQGKTSKIIITTHHMGLFSILQRWLPKKECEEKEKKYATKSYILSRQDDEFVLKSKSKDVLLYHLHLLQVLKQAQSEQKLEVFHFALLRQVLENIASFLGKGHFSYALQQIGIEEPNQVADIINAHTHQSNYNYQPLIINEDNETLLQELLDKLQEKYNFELHAG